VRAKKLLDEKGVSVVLGTILVVAILITFTSIYLAVWIPQERHRKEREHVERVRDAFLDLKSTIDALEPGGSRSVTVRMSADPIPFFAIPGAAGAAAVGSAALNTIVIYPSADAYVDNLYPDNNFGSATSLQVASQEGKNRRSFLRFSLENIPTGATILTAELWLYCSSHSQTVREVTDVRCFSVSDDGWMEGGITWNSQPAMGDPLDSRFINEVGWISLTAKDFVSEEVRGDKIVSLGLKVKQEDYDAQDRYVYFSSKESAQRKPYFKVSYIVGQARWKQTDWSGGETYPTLESGTWSAAYKKYYKGENVDSSIAGEVRLENDGGYKLSGWLLSSVYDAGTPVDWQTISWVDNKPSMTLAENDTVDVEPDPLVDGTSKIGSITGGSLDNAKTRDGIYENISEEIVITSTSYNPDNYNLLGSTKFISGGVENLEGNDNVYVTFRSYASAFSATSNSRAFIGYRSNTGAGTSTPKNRTWDGSNWGSENEMSTAGSPVRWVRAASCPLAARWYERIIVTLSDDDYLDAYVWNGSSWENYNNLGMVSSASYRPFDIAYEMQGGRAMLVYDVDIDDDTKDLGYRIWDGATWSDENYIDFTEVTSTNPTVAFLILANYPDNSSSQIAMVFNEISNRGAYAAIWDGSAWTKMTTLTGDQGNVSAAREAVAIQYATYSKKILALAGEGPNRMTWKTYTQGAADWVDQGFFDPDPDGGDDVCYGVLKADPDANAENDYIMYAGVNDLKDLNLILFNMATDPPTRTLWNEVDDRVDTRSQRCVDFEWEPTGHKGLVVWGTTIGQIHYNTFTAPSTWGSWTNQYETMGANTHRWIQLKRNPRNVSGDVKILGAVLEYSVNDLGAIKWDGSTFTVIGPNTFTADTGTSSYECFDLEFQLFGDPIEYTSEVEFIGKSDAYDWTELSWSIDSAWTTDNVGVTLQLYNYQTGNYPTSGDGYMSYTSSPTANTDETKTQTISTNPTYFRDANNSWKLKVKGIKSTSTPFDLKVDWIEFRITWESDYQLRWEHRITDVDNTWDNYRLLIYGYSSTADENVGIYIRAVREEWYNTSWTRRRPIKINNSLNTNALENYQVQVFVTFDSDMQSDFDDLRFTDNDKITPLNYWVENYNPNENATVWVKVPLIPANENHTIYMYYGNPAAASGSNGDSTFVFFDDFESGDLNKWTKVIDSVWSIASDQKHSGTYSLRASQVSSTDKYIVASGVNEADVLFEAWWRLSSDASDVAQAVRASSSTPINEYEINWEGGEEDWALAKIINGNWSSIITTESNPPSEDTWFKMTVIIKGTEMKILKDDSQLLPSSGWQDVGSQLTSGSIAFRAWGIPAGEYWWMDDVKVRKYTDPEPTTSTGDEEEIFHWAFIDNLPTSPGWVIYLIPDNISNYLVGDNFSILYLENVEDTIQTTIHIDYCALEGSGQRTTEVKVYTRSGGTENANDGTWSNWQLCISGSNVPSPDNRYIQYRLELTSQYSLLTPAFHEITISHFKSGAGALAYGALQLDVINTVYPSQTYVYESGAVIMIQNDYDLLVSSPTLITATDAEENNIRVDVNLVVIKEIDTSFSSTGTATIKVTSQSSSYAVEPVEGPNRENVKITILSAYQNAWGEYLEDVKEKLNAKGYNVSLSGLTLLIQGKDNTPGVKDIYYYEKVTEIEVEIT
jgi:hypothetical protein